MHCWPQSLCIAVVIALGMLNLLNACGQKGSLILPDAMPVTTPAPSAAIPVTAPAPATPTTRLPPH